MKKIKFNVKEIAEYLGCSESTARKLVREEKIPHYRIYSKILFDKNEIDKWLSDNQIYNAEKNNDFGADKDEYPI